MAIMLVTAMAALCAACSVSVSYGSGNPQAEQAYRNAIAGPFNGLTTAAMNANETCAGGSRPNPAQCYAFTRIEIIAARAAERALRGVPTPTRFVKANAELLHGFDIFIQGLIKRNAGLADHSTAEYGAGTQLIQKGLDIQRTAIAEYPKDANIGL